MTTAHARKWQRNTVTVLWHPVVGAGCHGIVTPRGSVILETPRGVRAAHNIFQCLTFTVQ